MTLAVSSLKDDDQLRFYDMTANMDSYQSECLDKVLGIKAKEISDARGDVARELGAWIRQHVLPKLEDYCALLKQELGKKATP